MIELLSNIIISLIHQSGYAGVFLLMTIESALVPMPSEVTMPFAGSLVSSGVFSFWLLVFIGAMANLTGSLLAYALGYLGEAQVVKFIRNYGKYVLIREKEFHHAQEVFNKHGELLVFGGRMLPAVRTYISLPAGIARMNFGKFVVYTFVGSFLWSVVLAYLGVMLGNNWRQVTPYFHFLDIIVVVGVLGGVGVLGYQKFFKHSGG